VTWQWIRRIVQLAFLFTFIELLLLTRWGGAGAPPPNAWFLRSDPLAALVSWLSPLKPAAVAFVPAAIILVLTALLGRVFCGWICPLGTTIDATDTLLWRKAKRRFPEADHPALKFYLLGATLIAALFGRQIAWLLDPIPLLTRTWATVLWPLGERLYNLAVTAGRPALIALGLRLYPVQPHPFGLQLATIMVLITIVGLGFLSRRYWCRNLCPLGALLAFIGRFGLLRRHVADSCADCRKCYRDCKMGAIPDKDYRTTLAPECILCFDCVSCPATTEATAPAGIGFLQERDGCDPALRASRRHFLAACGAGAAYAAAAATVGLRRPPAGARLIRPPGAVVRDSDHRTRRMSEDRFRDLCLRCGQCMKVCPTGGLQPAVSEASLDGIFTPVLVPQVGWCERNCNACGTVCPSGALQPFQIAEKPHIRLGTAAIHPHQCLAWQEGSDYRQCLVCNEACSYGAILLLPEDGRWRPFVNRHHCVGCGMCENLCPARPHRAIAIYRGGAEA
jgi:polyferredoxin